MNHLDVQSTDELDTFIRDSLNTLVKSVGAISTRLDQVEDRLKTVESLCNQILQTSITSTLPRHSQVVLNPRRNTPLGARIPRIM
jgi:hypothetical protein